VATVIAVVAALGAACFTCAAVVRHRGSGRVRDRAQPGAAATAGPQPAVARGQRPALSFAIQGLALAFGPLPLVQPLAATGALFTLPSPAAGGRGNGHRPQ